MRRSPSCRVGQTRWDVIIGAILGFMTLTLVVPFVSREFLFPRQRCGTSGRTQMINNLKQMALAIHSCNDVYKRLPPAFGNLGDIVHSESIHVHLLPFIEQEPLYKQYQCYTEAPKDATVSPYLNPLDPSAMQLEGLQSYAANLRVFADKGVETPYDQPLPELAAEEPGTAGIPRTFTDGISNTIVFATRQNVCGNGGSRYTATPISPFGAYFGEMAAEVGASPGDVRGPFLPDTPRSICVPMPYMAHSFGTVGLAVGLGDGSVRILAVTISPETFNRAMQPNDGKTLASDW